MRTHKHTSEMPQDAVNLVELLQWRAQQQPQQQAHIFLKDGENAEESLTYGELDQYARTIGALLQANQIAPGSCALLLYPPGLEYIAAFFGCLYSGVIAVPAYPPLRNKRSIQRLLAIAHDSQASAILTTTHFLEQEGLPLSTDRSLSGVKWLATDQHEMVELLGSAWQAPSLDASSLALLQYTSGSTSTPKGVMISHKNLLHNLALIEHCCEHTEKSHGVTWAPPYHDMGLVGGVLQPIYGGFPVTFMSPFAFLQRPIRWLQALSRTKGTTSGGPNFAYELCIHRISLAECIALSIDLSNWSLAFCSAEPVRHTTLERFAQVFEPLGFRREALYPCYGLAESTLLVTGGRKLTVPITRSFNSTALTRNEAEPENNGSDTKLNTLISSGRALPSYSLIIVDPETCIPCPPGRVGEIWIAGPCVAQGYWRQPEETVHFLRARPAGAYTEKPFLRSGDLGFLYEEELFVTGRLKDLIIIRGRNYYPQDIEQIASQAHPALIAGTGAAFSVDVFGEERLVLVHEVDRHHSRQDQAPIIDAIRQAVTEELSLQVYAVVLVKAASLPKTTSGKVQRYVCRKAFLEQDLDILAQSTFTNSDDEMRIDESERIWLTPQTLLATTIDQRSILLKSFLRQEIARLLNCAPAEIDVSQPLSVFGLDSLIAVELGNSIEVHCGVVLPPSHILQGASIASIALEIYAELRNGLSQKTTPVRTIAPDENAYPLSYGQQALWLLNGLYPDSTLYTIARAVKSKTKLDASLLRRALQSLIERHPSLRASFSLTDDRPIQKIHKEQNAFLIVEDARYWSDDALGKYLVEKAHLPFNLTEGPLVKVYLLEQSDNASILLFVVHHIVVDLWSLSILIQELGKLYSRERLAISAPLPRPRFHYSDFVRWQATMLAEDKGNQLKVYWENQFAGDLPLLNLPFDHPRSAIPTYKGSLFSFSIDESVTTNLKGLLQKKSITLYMALLTALQILLYCYTGQEDIIIGSPMANRETDVFNDVIGYFVNITLIRAKVSGEISCLALLDQTRREVLAALENQGYPFPLLVQHLQPERRQGSTPIVQVMFALQSVSGANSKAMAAFALNQPGETLIIDDFALESMSLKHETAEFDLTLAIAETNRGLLATIEYNTELFEEATIQHLAQHYQRVVEQMISNLSQPLYCWELLTEKERQEILVDWNTMAQPYPEQYCIHQLIEDQARRRPQAIALTCREQKLSYYELNRRANHLAHYLQTLGVGPDILVGICLERSLEMIVAMLAVLKAGGGYVPLDPSYPHQFLAFILQDAQVPILLTQQSLLSRLPLSEVQIICLDTEQEQLDLQSDTNPISEVSSQNLAYVIYTSGSTGLPKGVCICHRSVVIFLQWARQQFSDEELAGVLAGTSICFDLSIFELFVPLSWGGRAIIATSVLDLPQLAEHEHITLLNTVPSAVTALLNNGALPSSLLTINLAGEALADALVRALYRQTGVQRVCNLYGPTEDTTYSTWTVIKAEEQSPVTIGRPLINTQAYIVDTHMRPVPIGVAGELYLGGDGQARGYLNRPGLTAERFVPNPFSNIPGSRLYKTGDLVRYRPDGRIDYLGRLDHQVKVRGYRIEPGEIEAVLREYEPVKDAVVILREDPGSTPALVAYLVSHSISSLSLEQVRAFLRSRLPGYMLPNFFVLLENIPLTPNGKVDRKALPLPTAKNYGEEQRTYVPPRSSIERVVIGVWAEVLGVDQIGALDDFFECGGHSLLIIRVASRLRAIFQIELQLAALFQHTTVAALSSYIEQAGHSANIDTAQIADLLLYLNTLSDEEIHATLSDS